MSQPYVGALMLVPYTFAPAGWAFCQGQLVPISEFETLFNLLGTTYGGDGQNTFALPDLRGRVPMHQGSGNAMGESGGAETVTLTTSTLPAHSHSAMATNTAQNAQTPANNVLAQGTTQMYSSAGTPSVPMNGASLQAVGGSQPHENRQPYLTLNWIIALFGIYPSQN